MAIDIAIDPTTKDLILTGGRVNFTTDRIEIVRQRLESAIALVRGEWFLDLTAGIDWLTLLRQGQTEPIERAVIDVMQADPDVATAEVQVSVDTATRAADVQGTAQLTTGETVTVSVAVG